MSSSQEEEEEPLSGKEEEEAEWSESDDEEEEPLSGKEEEEEWSEFEEEEEEEEEEEKEEMPKYFSKKQEEGLICRLSPPSHPHTLSRQSGTIPSGYCYGGSESDSPRSGDMFSYFYHCTTCDVDFHKECYEWPRKMTHPYHPQHPLTLSVLTPKTGTIYEGHSHNLYHVEFTGVGIQDPGTIFDNCTWCGGDLKLNPYFYRCSICNFCLDPHCSKTFPLPILKNQKIHHHSLIFLPRPLLVPCDACGLVDRSDPSYACFQCNFVIHKSCIDLPRVIKLTRHPHRLFYTPFLSPKSSSCRLCYDIVDVKYGHFSCNQDDCSYVVHSKCATHETIWDGRELEWEPEEVDKIEDAEPFKKVGDGLIKYFCHDHHLKLEKYDGVRDTEKQCEACILHIDSRDFYNCMECDFFLHEVCANLPRKLDHALHNHPLFLDTAPPQEHDPSSCLVCHREFAGFRYKCYKTNCDDGHPFNPRKFEVDFGCILVSDFFTHSSHEHPVFIPIAASHQQKIWCKGCKAYCAGFYLKCTLCYFVICYKCATIPDKLHYKYVDLPLSLCYGEVSHETCWCEVCEEKLDPSQWFYTCNKPYITIHRNCVFGDSGYMKPGYKFNRKSSTVKFFPMIVTLDLFVINVQNVAQVLYTSRLSSCLKIGLCRQEKKKIL